MHTHTHTPPSRTQKDMQCTAALEYIGSSGTGEASLGAKSNLLCGVDQAYNRRSDLVSNRSVTVPLLAVEPPATRAEYIHTLYSIITCRVAPHTAKPC